MILKNSQTVQLEPVHIEKEDRIVEDRTSPWKAHPAQYPSTKLCLNSLVEENMKKIKQRK